MASAPEFIVRSPPIGPLKPFRFKSKRPRSPSTSDADPRHERSASPPVRRESAHRSHRSRRHHHHHHHHPRRRLPTRLDERPTTTSYQATLDSDTAFRESLFDALADDEGAAFWEGVYGQPINTYSPYYASPTSPVHEGNTDKPQLERMTDEEYVTYVRAKMWEKSHGYIVEERQRREREKRRRKAEEEECQRWQADIEEALARGAERRRKEKWQGVWTRYVQAWELVDRDRPTAELTSDFKNRICWPVESGRWQDVATEEVERFFTHVSRVPGDVKQCCNATLVVNDLCDVLKKERVRWHPDKMQQRAGEKGIDVGAMKLVTFVFQILDRLWTDHKHKEM